MKYKFTLDGNPHDWEQYITGSQLRQTGNVDPDRAIYLKQNGQEVEIEDNSQVDLALNGTEHFTTKESPRKNEVIITVNRVERKIHRGNQPVSEIKRVGQVPAGEILEQLIDGKLIPLADSGHVVIKGGEIFFSHVPDGGSS
jgi:hypothetical protein